MKTLDIEPYLEALEYMEELEDLTTQLIKEYDECTALDLPSSVVQRLDPIRDLLKKRGII